AVVLHRHQSQKTFAETRMTPLVNDRWEAELRVEQLGFTYFTVEAWVDHFLTWHRDLRKRVEELDLQLRVGLEMIRAAAARAKGRDRRRLERYVDVIEGDDAAEDKVIELQNDELPALMWRNAERRFVSRHACELAIEVDPPKAACSAWYELFPR